MADNEYKIPILSAAQLKKSKDEAHDREIRQNVKSHCTKIKDGITKNGSTSGNRAIWELFQNAGDLADCAEIKMTLTDNAFVFAHKGKPFTYDTLCSLVKQVSSEEKEDVEKVGQYGTGFLTTHKFSRKITIQGSMLICEDPKVYVDITDFVIDRENSYDIPKFIEDMAHQIKAVEKLMDNEQKTKPREWTELSYELNDERKKIAQTAIDEAIKLLPFVLTFNDNIGSCIIDDNTRNYHLVYTKEDKTTSIENLLCKQIIRNSTGIHKSKEYNCYYLELHEGKSRILLPLKSENEVISFGNTPRLFVHFPLIGPDYFKVDFLFHSHLFTPEEPRDNIIVPRENDATDQAASANKKVLDEMTAYLWGFLEQHVTQWKNTIQMAPIHIKDSGFTDAKTEEFYKNLKATWVEEFIKLLIVEVDGTNVSMAANNHPLVLDPKLENFLSMEENKRFLPTIYSYAHHVATIPSQDNLLSWSRIIAEWDKDKSEWYLTLDAIVKYVSLHQGTHLKEILLMLVEANELSFFETYPLLPNREMMLMKKNELRNAKSIIPELYKLVYAFDSSICAKFVHEEYADIVELTDYSRQDLIVIANDPEKEQVIGSLNALILNRLVTRINSKGNLPVSIIVDELPTLYFHKIDRLIGTARSNKVAVTLGFQELPQLEADYGKNGMQKIITTCGNIFMGAARNKETLEWAQNDVFGKAKQTSKSITINDSKVSTSISEKMDNLVPAAKIADMATGWLAGQAARDFTPTERSSFSSINLEDSPEFKTTKYFCKTNFNMAEIKKEEAQYVDLPKIYAFKDARQKEVMLNRNFARVNREIDEMIKSLLNSQ